jgi:hypothetical protein
MERRGGGGLLQGIEEGDWRWTMSGQQTEPKGGTIEKEKGTKEDSRDRVTHWKIPMPLRLHLTLT